MFFWSPLPWLKIKGEAKSKENNQGDDLGLPTSLHDLPLPTPGANEKEKESND